MRRLRELKNGDWVDMDKVDGIIRDGSDFIVAVAGLQIKIECDDSAEAKREMETLAMEVNVGLT